MEAAVIALMRMAIKEDLNLSENIDPK